MSILSSLGMGTAIAALLVSLALTILFNNGPQWSTSSKIGGPREEVDFITLLQGKEVTVQLGQGEDDAKHHAAELGASTSAALSDSTGIAAPTMPRAATVAEEDAISLTQDAGKVVGSGSRVVGIVSTADGAFRQLKGEDDVNHHAFELGNAAPATLDDAMAASTSAIRSPANKSEEDVITLTQNAGNVVASSWEVFASITTADHALRAEVGRYLRPLLERMADKKVFIVPFVVSLATTSALGLCVVARYDTVGDPVAEVKAEFYTKPEKPEPIKSFYSVPASDYPDIAANRYVA